MAETNGTKAESAEVEPKTEPEVAEPTDLEQKIIRQVEVSRFDL